MSAPRRTGFPTCISIGRSSFLSTDDPCSSKHLFAKGSSPDLSCRQKRPHPAWGCTCSSQLADRHCPDRCSPTDRGQRTHHGALFLESRPASSRCSLRSTMTTSPIATRSGSRGGAEGVRPQAQVRVADRAGLGVPPGCIAHQVVTTHACLASVAVAGPLTDS